MNKNLYNFLSRNPHKVTPYTLEKSSLLQIIMGRIKNPVDRCPHCNKQI